MTKYRSRPQVNNLMGNKLSISLIAGVLIIDILLGLWGELLPTGFHTEIENFTNGRYTLIWVLCGTVLIAALVLLTFRERKIDINLNGVERTNIREDVNRRFATTLKEIYQSRLRQKLDNRLEINIEYSYSKIGFSNEEVKNLYYGEGMQTEEEIREDLTHIYNNHNYMVILGEPGSGKTSRLLDLAVGLITQSEHNSSEILPIVLNLSPWKEDGDFGEWIVKAIVSMYGYPRAYVNEALTKNKIILFLDGFDELGQNLEGSEKQALRKATLKSIERFISKKDVAKLVLCSRITEYEQALSKEWKYKIDAQFLIKAISDKKVQDTLERSAHGKHRKEVRKLLSYFYEGSFSHEMKQVIATPFYFNALMVILENSDYEELNFPNTSEAIKNYITHKYIDSRLEQNSQYGKYNSKRYLAWLANWMKERQAIVFDVSHFIQKDRLETLTNEIIFGVIVSLIISFIAGLFYGLILGIVLGLPIGLVFGFATGLFLAMIHFILDRNSEFHIWHGRLFTEDQWVLDFNELKKIKTSIKILYNGLIIGLIYGLVFGLIGGLISELRSGVDSQLESGFIYGLIISFIVGLFSGLHGNLVRGMIYGLVFALAASASEDLSIGKITGGLLVDLEGASTAGCIMGVCIGLLEGMQRHSSKPVFFSHINSPYQRLLANWKKEMLLNSTVIFLLTLGFLIFFKQRDMNSLIAFSWIPAIALISFINTPMFQFLISNLILYKQKKFPFLLVPFLRSSVQINLLEQDGGSWRFRHQIIQDYFSDEYTRTTK